jgi:hypothetical protein
MTETDWVTSNDPVAMATVLDERFGLSDRKLWLLACACLSRARSVVTQPVLCWAVRTAGRYADGRSGHADMTGSANAIQVFASTAPNEIGVTGALWELLSTDQFRDSGLDRRVQEMVQVLTEAEPDLTPHLPRLFRCVFGPLLFRPVRLTRSIRTRTVVTLAQVLYEEMPGDELPILADALEDAGCTDTDIIGHLRSPGPHVRGCFAVDLCLNLT